MRKRPLKRRWALLALLLILLVWTLWGNKALLLHEITVSASRIPPELAGFRIAQVSDLHNDEFGNGNAKLVQMIAAAEPDIIAITGDLVDSRRTDIDVALDFVQEAVKIAPVYYVTGNHEARIAEYDELKAGLEKAGAVVLADEAVQIEWGGGALTLVGLNDPAFGSAADVADMVSGKLRVLAGQAGGYTVLLSHRPELFETYVGCGVDLALCGHAHGGQFGLPLLGGLVAPDQGLFPQYDAGLYTEGDTNMVVSRGIGNSIIPLRFNNRPEVVLVELQPAA